MKYLIIISFFFLSPLAHSKTWHNVSMEDQIEIAGQSLQLNGMALRKAVFFQVYVGGLYLKTPSKDSQAIINSQEMKHLNMQFIRSVSRSKIRKGFVKGYDKSCKLHCEKLRKHLEAFNDLIEDMGKNEKMSLTFNADSVTVSMKGQPKGIIKAGHEFNKILMSMYIGRNYAPSSRFRKEILGLSTKS